MEIKKNCLCLNIKVPMSIIVDDPWTQETQGLYGSQFFLINGHLTLGWLVLTCQLHYKFLETVPTKLHGDSQATKLGLQSRRF